MRRMTLTTAMVALAICGGCQYTNARLRDAADCIGASVTVGPGFMVDAQATWLARLGGGFIKGRRHALYYGEASSMSTMSLVIGLSPAVSFENTDNDNDINRWMVGLAIPACPTGKMPGHEEFDIANPLLSPAYYLCSNPVRGYRTRYGSSFMDVGFSLHIAYLGIEFRIRLAEIIDLLLGFAAIDIPGDDVRVSPEWLRQQESDSTDKP